MKRIIIIEDHPIVVFNLKLGLHGNDGVEVVDTFNSGHSLLSSKILESINLALLDINLPDMNGFEICKHLKTHFPHIKIIGISSFEDFEHISQLLAHGADGYLVKGAKNSEMLDAINNVLKGKQYLCKLAQAAITNNTPPTPNLIRLTKREQKLIELANISPNLNFISTSIGEDLEATATYFKLLNEKIQFYNIDIKLPNCILS